MEKSERSYEKLNPKKKILILSGCLLTVAAVVGGTFFVQKSSNHVLNKTSIGKFHEAEEHTATGFVVCKTEALQEVFQQKKEEVLLAKKNLKADKKYQAEIDLIEKLKENLNNGIPARAVECNEDEQELVKDMFLLTSKPIIYIANISEEQIQTADDEEMVKQVKEYAAKEHAEVIPLCVKIEEELSGLDDSDKKEMLDALGLEESGLDKLIKKSYDLLGLMSFLTAGETEVRAWTITKGTKAPQAAGKIHSDFERGFIKAEVVSYNDLMKEGSMLAAKEKGLVRQEGKEYVMQDGDIVVFKFNV